jgi:hypothetical protein
MTALILTEVGLGCIAAYVFALLYAARSPWLSTAMGRHVMFTTVAIGTELLSLFLLGLQLPIPLWVFVFVFGALDAVIVQRLYLLWLAQRQR